MIIVKDKKFHLFGKNYSYIFCVRNNKLYHIYYGTKLNDDIDINYEASDENICFSYRYTNDFEIGEFGRGDYRTPGILVHNGKCLSTEFEFVDYKILGKKPKMQMPSLRNSKETLKISLLDKVLNLYCNIYYTPYEECLTRHIELINRGKKIVIDKLMSIGVDFPCGEYKTLTLNGAYSREREVSTSDIPCGINIISSNRGASSHQHNPFIALIDKSTTEESGNVYAFNLIYSGNFLIETERTETDKIRINVGMNILNGGIELLKGKRFISPECVTVYSNCGLGEMSRIFHRTYRTNLIPEKFVDTIRPIVLNSWESMYFDFDENKFFDFISGAKGLGIDMIVMDDGWFGHRNDDKSSLGDWFVNKNKFNNGLKPIIDSCKKCGMKFGIWFEPEMISPDSELYKAHEDWCIHTEGREGVLGRNQLVLDFSKKEVVDNIFDQMLNTLGEFAGR